MNTPNTPAVSDAMVDAALGRYYAGKARKFTDLDRRWSQPAERNQMRAALEAALATPQRQGAVAWVSKRDPMFKGGWRATTPMLYAEANAVDDLVPLYTAPQPAGNTEATAEDAARLRIACGCVMQGSERVIACRGHAIDRARTAGKGAE